MTRLFYFPTAVGIFYICKDAQEIYYPFIEDIALGSYPTLVDAIESIAHDTTIVIPHPEMGDPLDPTDLSVPDDISGWKAV